MLAAQGPVSDAPVGSGDNLLEYQVGGQERPGGGQERPGGGDRNARGGGGRNAGVGRSAGGWGMGGAGAAGPSSLHTRSECLAALRRASHAVQGEFNLHGGSDTPVLCVCHPPPAEAP